MEPLPCCQFPGQLMVYELWQGRSTCITPHTPSPWQLHPCLRRFISCLFLALICGERCSYSTQVLITCPSHCFLWAHYSKAYFTVCVRCWVFCTCYGNVFFGLLSMCVNDPMCNKRFPLHALLVTTLKSHMCLQQSGCVLWLFSLVRFLWFGFQWISQGFALRFGWVFLLPIFAYEGIFNYWNLLSIQSFCGIKLYCTDPKFPCSVQEDG